jgi:hypothetical protein
MKKRDLQMTITAQLILFASKYASRLFTACYNNNIMYLSKWFVQMSGWYYLRLCKRDYRIIFSIITVSVSETPSILRISSIQLLMSAIAGAAIIAAISYWPVIS